MSDGKILQGDQESNPLQKIFEVNQKCESISRRLMGYDRFDGEIKDAHQKIASLSSKIKDLEDKLENSSHRIKSLLEMISVYRADSLGMNDDVMVKINSFHQRLENHKDSINDVAVNLLTSVKTFTDKLNSSVEKSVDKETFLAHKRSIENDYTVIKENFDRLFRISNDFVGRIKLHDNKINSVESSIQDNYYKLIGYIEPFETKVKSYDQKIRSLETLLDLKLKQEVEKLSDKIDKSKEEAVGSPSSIESTKSSLLKKMQTVELDASNAQLKATNSDQQIKVLEKKIENIQLLLKQYQLTQ